MPDVRLSANAVASLRFHVKGWHFPIREQDLPGYQELVDAGIMEPDGDDFRFTEDGHTRRAEILAAAEAHLRSLEPRLPERIDLSRAARKTLRRHVAGERAVTDANREAYRELARAGIMQPVSTFVGGSEAWYQFTWQGWERRLEFQRPWPRFSASAMARSLSLAIARIGKRVSAAR